jgi:uncharacterized membrane protein
MIIMALDHVRDLLHQSSISASPTDLSSTTPLLFFTRWITYLCAPIFVFLAGTSVFLSQQRKNDLPQSRRFILKRGLFLILLEFTIVNFGLFMDTGFHFLLFEVIAAIGFGFIILSLLMPLKPSVILLIGLAILLLHDAVIFIPMKENSLAMTVLSPLFSPSAFPFSGRLFVMGYPPIPWLGILLLGYGSGRIFLQSAEKRAAIFLGLAFLGLLLFILLRFINLYGDPAPWAKNKNTLFSFLSFMNVTKYPPSLLFSLVTLGFMFLFLWAGERIQKPWARIPLVYGQAPLFYFVLHFYMIHIILLVVLFLQGFHWSQLEFAGGTFGRPKGQPSGLQLWAIYLIWPTVVALLYKPCRWFARYRKIHSYFLLKYI